MQFFRHRGRHSRARGTHRKHRVSWWLRLREYIWPSMGLGSFLRYQKVSIQRQKDSPHRLAGGVAIGVFIGFMPTFGQPLLAILFAWLLGFHMIAATITTFLGNPWTFPFIWAWCYQLGHWMMGTENYTALPNLDEAKHILENPEFLWSDYYLPILIGGIPSGIICALLSYGLIYWYMKWYQHHRGINKEKRAHAWRCSIRSQDAPPAKAKRKEK